MLISCVLFRVWGQSTQSSARTDKHPSLSEVAAALHKIWLEDAHSTRHMSLLSSVCLYTLSRSIFLIHMLSEYKWKRRLIRQTTQAVQRHSKKTHAELRVCRILDTFKSIFVGSPLPHFEKPRTSVGKQRQLLQHDVFWGAELLSQIYCVSCKKCRENTLNLNKVFCRLVSK